MFVHNKKGSLYGDPFFIIYNIKINFYIMKLSVKISTIWVFIIAQTLISIIFYLGDKFVSGWEALLTFIISIPLTYLIQWFRGENNSKN